MKDLSLEKITIKDLKDYLDTIPNDFVICVHEDYYGCSPSQYIDVDEENKMLTIFPHS